VSPFLTLTLLEGAEKYGDAVEMKELHFHNLIRRTIKRTIDFQLNDFSDPSSNSIVSLANVETFSVFFHMLQQQRPI
jgi:hypothetical protein